MRVAVVDIGTNSTRLLVADVDDGKVVRQLDRRSEVTRLGEGVDATGAPGRRAHAARLPRARRLPRGDRRGRARGRDPIGVLTSAVRDAENGAEFTQAVRERFGFDARTIDGDTEAELTFPGATSERDPADTDPAGGGRHRRRLDRVRPGRRRDDGVPRLHPGRASCARPSATSTPTRRGPRSSRPWPPRCAASSSTTCPTPCCDAVSAGIGVAGTATSCAAIAQELDPYDPDKVHGYVLERTQLDDAARAIGRPAARASGARCPACTPTARRPSWPAWSSSQQVLDAFALDRVEVSEHDILEGAARDGPS